MTTSTRAVAWRRTTGELLILDLEMIRVDARFYDAARWLGAPDAVQPRCLPREELAQHYLAEYIRRGGTPVPLERFLQETSLLWLAQTLNKHPGWKSALDGSAESGSRDAASELRRKRGELYRELSILLALCPV